MQVQDFIEVLQSDFYTGVPDSLLRSFCDYLMESYGIDNRHHIIAANEGNCVALAAGYHLSTEKVPVVYMQNSGEGNIINPVASLLNNKIYAIPMIFVIGWRGEPGLHDEPQHIYQGQVTLKLLDDMKIEYYVVDKETTPKDLKKVMTKFSKVLNKGNQVAFVIRKGALLYDHKKGYKNGNRMLREEIIQHIVAVSGESPIIATTGKASRELFEIREKQGKGHHYDFLTVGSMGHSSSIALGVAINKPKEKVWCIDGDGALLMHMGAVAVIGATKPQNFVHIVINNVAHESVGGLPTVAGGVAWTAIAKACGYDTAEKVDDFEALDSALNSAKSSSGLHFIEVLCAIGARSNLGRPTTTALENKKAFMEYLNNRRIKS